MSSYKRKDELSKELTSACRLILIPGTDSSNFATSVLLALAAHIRAVLFSCKYPQKEKNRKCYECGNKVPGRKKCKLIYPCGHIHINSGTSEK